MLWLHQELLDEDVLVAESLSGLVLHQLELPADILLIVAAAHAPAAAAGGRLQDDGEAIAHRLLHRLVRVLQRLGRAGDDGHAAGDGGGLGGQLVPHLGQDVGGRADELDAILLTGPGKVGVLAQKAVAGVDSVHPPAFRQVDNARNVQIGPQRRLIFADQVGFIRLDAEQAVDILVGVHRHGVQSQVITGPEDANGDFAAVSGQNFGKLFRHGAPSNFISFYSLIPLLYRTKNAFANERAGINGKSAEQL